MSSQARCRMGFILGFKSRYLGQDTFLAKMWNADGKVGGADTRIRPPGYGRVWVFRSLKGGL
jgi:hypothetical protein